MSPEDLSRFSMLDLFRAEADIHTPVLIANLLALEHDPTAADRLEACMRAAHSLKGAARIVGLTAGVSVAHALEDCFVAAQEGRIAVQRLHIDRLLAGVDLLTHIATTSDTHLDEWADEKNQSVCAFLRALDDAIRGDDPRTTSAPDLGEPDGAAERRASAPSDARDASERVLRVTADSLNRLLGLASESLVESRWVKPFAESLQELKRIHDQSDGALGRLRESLSAGTGDRRDQTDLIATVQVGVRNCQQVLSQRLGELEMYDRRSSSLSHRLYDEALRCRMRPFADGIQRFPRIVRDLGHSLGKQAHLEIVGEKTQVDRDILAKLDAPLGHLLRNAVDHGLETPEERLAAGKPVQGVVRLEARHTSGALQVIVSDDGRGVDVEKLRTTVLERKLTNLDAACTMTEAELLEFLFLPGFSMKGTITDMSGRGVGLDVVRNMVQQVRGVVRVTSQRGKGTQFQMQLPVTLSVVRTLIADIGGEPYAFPLAHIARTLRVPHQQIERLEGRPHFDLNGRAIGLITAHQVLGISHSAPVGEHVSVIVIGDAINAYGLIVDGFRGERELVVQPLDPHLGKIKDVAAGALMEDGAPVLIVDTADMVRSIEHILAGSRLALTPQGPASGVQKTRKRVLVVDDSLTVREVERKLLSNCGYDVEVAVDGMDGWNAVRTGRFHLVVTDIDMPRMDGIELVTLINRDPQLKSTPVMVVSYKDRDEDRRRGLDAGAAHYLTKSSFHDETLVQAVVDLIGEAES